MVMTSAPFPDSLIAEASRAISRYAGHQRVLEAMALRLPLPQVLTRLAQSIEDSLPGSLCAVMLVDETGTRISTGAAPSVPVEFNDYINGVIVGPVAGSCGTAVALRKRIVVKDIATDPLWADYRDVAIKSNLRACWSTPIIASDGTVLGSFAVYYRTPRLPEDADIRLVDDAVDLACVAINQEHSELSLRRSEAHYRTVVATAPSPIVELSQTGVISEWNQAAETLFGRARSEMLGKNFAATCLIGDSQKTFEASFEEVRTRRTHVACETRIVRADGIVRFALWGIAPVSEDSGDIIAVGKDITVRLEAEAALRRTEQERRQSQKMEAVGRLAGGIAHDFNNLLTVIYGNTSLALQDAVQNSAQYQALDEVRDAAARASSLTRQLLTFSRQEAVTSQSLDLNEIVENLRRMLRRVIGAHVQLETQLHPVPLVVRADRTNIEQLLINLVVNARDAMPEGGTIHIETEMSMLDIASAAARGVESGSYVCLTVRDTGTGMDELTRTRAFEPFFTTKESGEGTGLGLATAYAVAIRSSGTLEIESEPGLGTTMKLWLPLVEHAADAPAVSTEAHVVGGSGTVLIVEDEASVRSLAQRILSANGYCVLEASNGEEALAIWEERQGNIDILVTDVVMPRMGGEALAERLRSDRPGLAVVFCSGYADNKLVSIRDDDPRSAFLAKPFTLAGLMEQVARLTNSSSSPA